MTPPLPPPPPPGANKVKLTVTDEYGGLHFHESDVLGLSIAIADSDPPTLWKLQIKNPDGNNLHGDSTGMELQDLYMVLAYTWT
jgi:hypothetical protein